MMGKIRKFLAGPILIVSIALYFLPPPADTSQDVMRAGALVVFAMGFWATGVLPEYVTSLTFILLGVLSHVAPPSVIFSGFSSKALWLVFGGLILAAALQRTGIGQRLASHLSGIFGTSYPGVIAGVVFLTMVAGFFMPSSMGRVVVFLPICLAMADRLGFEEGTPGRKGMVTATIFGCYVPSCAVLPAGVPNMVLAGASESLYNLPFGYGQYLNLHYPITGLMKGMAIALLVCFLFPDRVRMMSLPQQEARGPLTKQERLLALILSGTLLLWATDFLHGISPAWVALAAGLLCLLPPTKLLSREALSREVNLSPFFYVAGVLGVGAIIAKTALGDILGKELLKLIDFKLGHTAQNFFLLVILYMAMVLLTTGPGLPAVMAPLSADIAAATGFPLMTVLMAQVIGFSTPFLPYAIPPLMVGMQLGALKAGETAKFTLALAVISIVFLVPLNYLWWTILAVF